MEPNMAIVCTTAWDPCWHAPTGQFSFFLSCRHGLIDLYLDLTYVVSVKNELALFFSAEISHMSSKTPTVPTVVPEIDQPARIWPCQYL